MNGRLAAGRDRIYGFDGFLSNAIVYSRALGFVMRKIMDAIFVNVQGDNASVDPVDPESGIHLNELLLGEVFWPSQHLLNIF